MLIVTNATHLDHSLSPSVLAEVLAACTDATAPTDGSPFIRTVSVSTPVPCALRGPAAGDAPILPSDPRVYFGPRANRPYISRLYDASPLPTNLVTVIGGAFGLDSTLVVVWTMFGGPLAPREPGDPAISSHSELIASLDFWNEHALCLPRAEYYAAAQSFPDPEPDPDRQSLEDPND